MATATQPAKIDIGRVIGRSVDALRRNLLGFAGFALLLAGSPALAVDYLFQGVFSDAAFDGPLWTLPIAVLIVDSVFGSLLFAILVRSAILTLEGDGPYYRDSVLTALRLLPQLVALSLLANLIVLIGMIGLIVPGLILWVALAVALPVYLFEERGIIDSLRRSAELTAGNRGRIFLLLLLYWLIWSVLLAGAVFSFSAEATAWSPGVPTLASIAQALVSAAMALIAAPVTASLYVELRTGREGPPPGNLTKVFG